MQGSTHKMDDAKQRLEHAKWLFERTLHWIATADIKVGTAMALDTAMFGGLAAAYGLSDSHAHTAWLYVTAVLSCFCLIAAVFCAAMASIPRMLGPVASNIYFARISEQSVDVYIDTFSKLDESDFLNDLITQIHRNAEIATAKHTWVRKGLVWSFLASGPWAVAIIILVNPQ